MELAQLHGGRSDGPLLVLLHGLGGHAGLWADMVPLIERDWPGRWCAPDLRSHGQTCEAADCSLAAHVDDVVAMFAQEEPAAFLGHSMGGAVAIAAAAQAFPTARVAAFGVKAAWSADLVARFHALAAAPPRVWPAQEEAAARFVAAAGLKGVLDASSPMCARGVARAEQGWTLAARPAVHGVAGAMVGEAAAALGERLLVLRGEYDPVVEAGEAVMLSANPHTLTGLGHNPHVENPDALWAIVAGWLLGQPEH
jgi:pimeloyl-ACP methyl ester carboxylesterase